MALSTASTSKPPPKSISSVMFWTKEHDVILCREVLNTDIYKTKKKSPQRTVLWERIATLLNEYASPMFNVDKRAVRDHIGILVNRYKKKMRAEENASGITPPEPTELDNMLEEIMELEGNSEMEFQEMSEEKKDKAEQERNKVEDMRIKAMEKISETKRRQNIGDEKPVKRQRRSGGDTIAYLKEKAAKDQDLKAKELELKREKQELDKKKLDATINQQLHFQQEQTEMIRMMQQRQQQSQQQLVNAQILMMKQQQEQTKTFMDLLEKVIKK